jgi:cytochrome P450/NADPH-cytochrome P450 reductase
LHPADLKTKDTNWLIELKSTLTVKPMDLNMKVRRRPGKSPMVGIPGAVGSSLQKDKVPTKHSDNGKISASDQKPTLTIIYGSNAGTCKSMAEDFETFAGGNFEVTVLTMDGATEHLPRTGTVAIITPSYEGKPPDNGKKFMSWLEASSDKKMLEGVNFAVFGVGNSEWSQTYHRIPKRLDEILPTLGANRLQPADFIDVKEDIIGPWEDWKEKFISTISGEGMKPLKSEDLVVEIKKPEAAVKLGGEEMSFGLVRKNEEIAGTDVGPAKRHIEIELPEGTTYRTGMKSSRGRKNKVFCICKRLLCTGDYLVVLPTNPPESIEQVLSRFQLHADDILSITGTNKSFLVMLSLHICAFPSNIQQSGSGPMTITELIGARVELGTPVSQRQLQAVARTAAGEEERKQLEQLCTEDSFKSEILAKRMSVLDILEDFPSCELPFASYLDMLKPLAPRQYSISSSPLATIPHVEKGEKTPIIASITFDVHTAPARSGNGRVFRGVASSYLAGRAPNSKIRCFVRATNASFHLPKDPETSVIMICAGTGLAPMRGFIEERAQIAQAGSRKLGKALLYFGCRHNEKDFIYAEQLKEWEKMGAVELRTAFSQQGPAGQHQYKYVHDRMWDEREELADLFKGGAKMFVCGSASKLAKSSADVCMKIWREKHPGSTEDDAFEWLQQQREDRYVSDVFD